MTNEPLLLLPGMMCDGRLFAPQVARFSSDRAVMIAPLTGQQNFTDLAMQTLDNAPPKFALAGLSMGGIAAMEIMRLAPERVTRLALLDTNHLPDTPERRAGRDVQIAKANSGGLRAIMRDEMKPNYLADGPRKTEVLDLCMEMAETLGPEVFVRQSRALQSRIDQRETLANTKIPTLILCGAEDTLCPVERHKDIQSLMPNARLAIIKKAGHLPVLEQAEATNKEVALWLAD